MLPRHVGGRYPTPGSLGEDLSALSGLPFYTYNLAERVHYLHQIALRFHYSVDRLVRHRCFVNDFRVFTALDAGGCLCVIIQREATLRLGTRHGTSGSMTTTHEAFRIALAAHDVRTRAHAARNDSHVALTCTHCSFTCDEYVFA